MNDSPLPRIDGCRPTRDGLPMLMDYPARLLVYGGTAIAVCQLVFLAIRQWGIEFAARENGAVELAQVWLALFTSGCLLYAAYKMRFGRHVLVLCGCLVGYAAARECDTWFETVLFDDAYKYVAGAPLFLVAITALYHGRTQIFDQARALVRTPAITIFAFAGIYICSVCQVFDRPDLWTEVGVGPSAEMTKAAIEEFAELFGYLMLAFSGVESVVMSLARETVAESVNVQPTQSHRIAA